MAKRGRRTRNMEISDSAKSPTYKQGRVAKLAHVRPEEPLTEHYPVAPRLEETRAELALPYLPEQEETALAVIDLNPWYETISEMRERIREAEQNLSRSRQAQQLLQTEIETVTQMAEAAEKELAEAAKKAALLKHEAKQVCTDGQLLQEKLCSEEQIWQQRLQQEQQLLSEAEQKLRVAEEETQRINHAKEVAARMNEKEMWRLGSSKQGLWLQRRKVQGNTLPMSRGKDGNWQLAKVAASPGATYAQNLLEREQKLRDDYDPQEQNRLDKLSESARAIAERQSSQLEEDFLEQLAAGEAERHLAALAGEQSPEQRAAIANEAARLEAAKAEAERLEAARIAAAKAEAERIEAERIEAARMETAKAEAERIEAARIEAAKAEAERIEAARIEAAKAEAARIEAERMEAAKAEAERIEAARIEAAKAEAERIEAARIEAAKAEAAATAQPFSALNQELIAALRNLDTSSSPAAAPTIAPVAAPTMAPEIPAQEPPTLNHEIAALLQKLELPAQAKPAINIEVLDSLRPASPEQAAEEAIAAAEALPAEADPLQFLAMRAASRTAANQTAGIDAVPGPMPDHGASANFAQLPQTPPAATVIPMGEEDINRLSQQANLLAQQHLSQLQPQREEPLDSRAAIVQKVAEETGRHDHLLKEQQTAEMAIAAAMAAARKAAQSAMAISEQVNQQMPALTNRGLEEEDRPYSVERIIADALSKAAVANQNSW